MAEDKEGNAEGNPARPPSADERSRFDRFAAQVTRLSSRPMFFIACIGLVILWLLEGVARVLASGPASFLEDTYQIQINTLTTIVTFLMVALLQNAQQRFENSLNAKLNAMADALADFMEVAAEDMSSERCTELDAHATALRRAVGAEGRVGA